MIDPDDVVEFEAGPEPRQPPGVIGGLVPFPIIQRVSPELAVSGEIVRRDTGDRAWIEIRIHFEQAGVGPDVRAVHRYENRNVSEISGYRESLRSASAKATAGRTHTGTMPGSRFPLLIRLFEINFFAWACCLNS